MAVFKWGSTEIKVLRDTYIPPYAETVLTEIHLIPAADNLDPQTVIQQGGRGRYRVNFSASVSTYTEYQALMDDYINQTQRTFVGADGYSENMTISALSQAARKLYPTRFEISMTLVEV